ncbi:hypothetical protein [Streptococcus pacificus]|uniref:Lipoprotein n=1 Tax=Streptococcus pacificus TaxID=2740577 RepID=A0ABS0ZJU9_9STRE|nr:hypothetical protein [Streptococcus pacificus]MBJ8326244.1 hypothetical protein [Streptococcus pacificus]
MFKKNKLITFIVILLVLSLGIFFLFQKLFDPSKSFAVSSDVDFYIVGYNNIEGYQLGNNDAQKVSDEEVEIVKGQINQVIMRAELSNRYLVFSEEGRPLGTVGRIIAIDFKNGTIKYNKTPDYAYTSSGVSSDYYFSSEANTEDSFIAVFDENLEEIDKYTFENGVLASDFSIDNNDNIYFIGVDVAGDETFPAYLYTFSFKDKTLKLENKELLYENPDVSYSFIDSIVKNNHLYAISPGYRINATKERVVLGQIFHYDMNTGQKEMIDLPEIAPYNIFDLSSNLLAIEHEPNDSGKIGFSLFHLNDRASTFIDLSPFGLSIEGGTDYLKDVKQIDDNTLLILAGDKLIGYNISDNTVIFEQQTTDDSFHIWVN